MNLPNKEKLEEMIDMAEKLLLRSALLALLTLKLAKIVLAEASSIP